MLEHSSDAGTPAKKVEEHSSKQECGKAATSSKQMAEKKTTNKTMEYSSKEDRRTQHQTKRWNTAANKMMEHSSKHDVGTQQQIDVWNSEANRMLEHSQDTRW
jgi:hypothetical protein